MITPEQARDIRHAIAETMTGSGRHWGSREDWLVGDALKRVSLPNDLAALHAQLEETQRQLEEARLQLDDKAPNLRAAVQSVSGGQARLMSAYQESESRLWARIEAAERVVDCWRRAPPYYDAGQNDPHYAEMTELVAAYDAVLLAEQRRVDAAVRAMREE